jgi:hypothetical protein
MLRTVLNWFGRKAPSRTPPTHEHAQRAEATARQDRASLIEALYRDGRQLQQAIKDASDALERSATADERTVHERQLASLHDALRQKQSELARIQGRI